MYMLVPVHFVCEDAAFIRDSHENYYQTVTLNTKGLTTLC